MYSRRFSFRVACQIMLYIRWQIILLRVLRHGIVGVVLVIREPLRRQLCS